MITKAEKVDGGYISKWRQNVDNKWYYCRCSCCMGKIGWSCKRIFVEKGFKGFTAPEMKGKHSLRASVTSELIFDNVFIPEENFCLKLTD